MKQLTIALIVISVLIIAGCAALKRESSSRSEISGAWLLTSIRGEDDPDKLYKEARIPELVFDADKLSVSGNNGCNRVSGKYKLPQKGKIEFGPMISTKMACPGIGNGEQLFMHAMEKVTAFTVEGDELRLLEGRREILKFSRKK